MTLTAAAAPPTAATTPSPDPRRRLGWNRVRGPLMAWALAAATVSAVGETAGTVVAGRLAEHPTTVLVELLALALVGGAVMDTVGRTLWSSVSDRAEGQLRADLLSAALDQPLAVLSETAVGEVLDRIDDDTHELGVTVRLELWDLARTLLRAVPMYVVAGITFWPSFVLFPLVGLVLVVVVRPLAREVTVRKIAEEIAWTDHAAALEEGIAARDDLRASLGQSYLVRRVAELSAVVHERVAATCKTATSLSRRTGLLLHGLLAATAVAGVALVSAGQLSTAALVTLFLVTSAFVGQIDQVARHVPDLQQGLGALTRLRQLLAVAPEPVGGLPVPPGQQDVSVRDLSFAYPEGSFALQGIDLDIPAGHTTALVGRTGSGKSTLAALLSRAVDPPRGTVHLGGVDVLDLDLQQLRATVGVVTQRTEVLAATLAENITLFADIPRTAVERAVADLGLTDWVEGLPAGLDTLLGPGGSSLSAGEEQLVAFARLLVRDVQVVVLDEATARMDPVTEARVVQAAERLLSQRTGVVVAHRLSTTERAQHVVVLDAGRVLQQGPRTELAHRPGAFRDLLLASGQPTDDVVRREAALGQGVTLGSARRTGEPRPEPVQRPVPSLSRATAHVLAIHPRWGLLGAGLFLVQALLGAFGALTGLAWGQAVTSLRAGRTPVVATALLTASLMIGPLVLASAMRIYPQWWIAVNLRVRLSVLLGQTRQERLPRTPPGEVVARALDADRFARYGDRWVDLVNGSAIVVVTAACARSLLAGGVLASVLVLSALASSFGSPVAGRSATQSSGARAAFGRSLVSALDCARTVKLAAATPAVHRHLQEVDGGRVEAAVFEHRIQALLDGLPVVLVKCGVVAAWYVLLQGGWGLATALLVTTAVNGYDWFGRVAGAVITEAPGVRSWQLATTALAGGGDLMDLPAGVDLVHGTSPQPPDVQAVPLSELELRDLGAIHDDGTIGLAGVDLKVHAGELVLLLGQVGSGKSSLLSALAGLVDHTGSLLWNGREITEPQLFLRPGQVAHVGQVPRVLSGTFADNVRLDHRRDVGASVEDARLTYDVQQAGGAEALVGHRGVRLSGGQIQRLALARALAAQTDLLLADDVSSALDARTEVELWRSLRARGTTVIGATSKWAALQQADRVVVLVDGTVAASGPWAELAPEWGHLAG